MGDKTKDEKIIEEECFLEVENQFKISLKSSSKKIDELISLTLEMRDKILKKQNGAGDKKPGYT